MANATKARDKRKTTTKENYDQHNFYGHDNDGGVGGGFMDDDFGGAGGDIEDKLNAE